MTENKYLLKLNLQYFADENPGDNLPGDNVEDKDGLPEDYEEIKRKLKEFEDGSHVSTLENELQALKNQAKNDKITSAFKELAEKKKIQYVDAAIKLSDLESFEIGEDGSIEGLSDAVEKLVKENPFLVSNEQIEIGGSSNPGLKAPVVTQEQFHQMSYTERVQLYEKNSKLYQNLAENKMKRR